MYEGVLCGLNACGREKREAGLGRGKFSCDAVPIKVSADSPENSRAEKAPGGQAFSPLCWLLTAHRPRKLDLNLGRSLCS